MQEVDFDLIIDAGNSRIKIVEVQNDEFLNTEVYSLDQIKSGAYQKKVKKNSISLLSSVLSTKETAFLNKLFQPIHLMGEHTSLPFINKYKSNTLGSDRMANAAFAASKVTELRSAVLIVDVGTCVKFDFVNENREYLGGSISPGIKMRYRSMNEFTGQLPLLDFTSRIGVIGDSTEKSMWSGVMNGVKAEIEGMIRIYSEMYKGLTTFMTGGDAHLFDIEDKNHIFVNENLTLRGLNIIRQHNAN